MHFPQRVRFCTLFLTESSYLKFNQCVRIGLDNGLVLVNANPLSKPAII